MSPNCIVYLIEDLLNHRATILARTFHVCTAFSHIYGINDLSFIR